MLRSFAAAMLLLAALSLGCAGSSPKSDNVSQDALNADYNDCESRAFVSTALIKSGDAAEARHQEIIDECMKEKGYNVK